MKRVGLLLLLLLSGVTFSQNKFQGKAVYISKTTIDMSVWGNQISEQRKQQIKEQMKNFLEKTFILNFTQSESTYKEDAKLEVPTAGGGRGFRGFGGFSSGVIYKNTKEGNLIEATEFFEKKFLIKEKPELPQWELGSETKKIGKYTCYKATMTKVNNDFDWTVFRRKPNQKKDSSNAKKKDAVRTTFVTAWYTPEIPISNGPDDFGGLPGLILEINAGRTTMLCTEVVLNPAEKVVIKTPVKGEEVTREEYNKIIKEKTEEMRERFRGRGGKGRGRGRS
ncbi:MAG: GLPGLI family protein [Flavobacteriaceae bacterium]|nr:MAG: GLPGLI family protein [Flavobacteriaceae bacterium]